MENDLEHDKHHLDKYKAFCELYGIADWQKMVKLYDIFELVKFPLPPNPTEKEKTALQMRLVQMQNQATWTTNAQTIRSS